MSLLADGLFRLVGLTRDESLMSHGHNVPRWHQRWTSGAACLRPNYRQGENQGRAQRDNLIKRRTRRALHPQEQ